MLAQVKARFTILAENVLRNRYGTGPPKKMISATLDFRVKCNVDFPRKTINFTVNDQKHKSLLLRRTIRALSVILLPIQSVSLLIAR